MTDKTNKPIVNYIIQKDGSAPLSFNERRGYGVDLKRLAKLLSVGPIVARAEFTKSKAKHIRDRYDGTLRAFASEGYLDLNADTVKLAKGTTLAKTVRQPNGALTVMIIAR